MVKCFSFLQQMLHPQYLMFYNSVAGGLGGGVEPTMNCVRPRFSTKLSDIDIMLVQPKRQIVSHGHYAPTNKARRSQEALSAP